MSIAPKVIHVCDHVVVSNTKSYGDIKMTRNTIAGFPDKVPANIQILRVDNVLSQDKLIEYSPGINYSQKVSSDILEWTNHKLNPKQGEEYYIRCCYIKVSTERFDGESCERCGGNGWYVGIFSENSSQIVLGKNKLIQDFISVLFTEKDATGRGSKIKDIISSNIYNEASLSLEIATIMSDCEDQIKTSQREHMNGGSVIDEDEMLSQINVKDVIFVRDETTCYVSIEIINGAGDAINFGFKV